MKNERVLDQGVLRWRYHFTTLDEMRFIDGLGKHSGVTSTRKILLQNYLKTTKWRRDWGLIDKEAVIAHARQALEALN